MPRELTKRVTFCETPQKYKELEDYVGQKKRWKSVNDLARDAVWQFLSRNKLTAAQMRAVEQSGGE